MTAKGIENWIEKNYVGLNIIDAYGERSFFYNPENLLPKGVYFATIKTTDGPKDKASNLNREHIYRLSFGIGKNKFVELFGEVPKRPEKGKVVDLKINFEEENVLKPHPIYSWISWVCILSPKKSKIEEIKFLLDITYQKTVTSYLQKQKKTSLKH